MTIHLQPFDADIIVSKNMRLTVHQFIDSDRDAQPSVVVNDTEVLETMKKSNYRIRFKQ